MPTLTCCNPMVWRLYLTEMDIDYPVHLVFLLQNSLIFLVNKSANVMKFCGMVGEEQLQT